MHTIYEMGATVLIFSDEKTKVQRSKQLAQGYTQLIVSALRFQLRQLAYSYPVHTWLLNAMNAAGVYRNYVLQEHLWGQCHNR